MFEYFEADNYLWNLAVVLSLNTGGAIHEIDQACRPLREQTARGTPPSSEAFLEAWTAVADRLAALAGEDEQAGRVRSAGDKYARAANYLTAAERLQAAGAPGRVPIYERVLSLLTRSVELRREPCQRVEVPFNDSSLPAYLVTPEPAGEPFPCVIQWNGLDSTKEMMYQSGFAAALAARGVATLAVDTPGSGEALRLRGLAADPATERWAAACLDFLETRPELDPDRVGIVGWSLGGYYAPRAAAFEKRLKLCVAWGANHNWGALQHRRLRNEGERPVPHYWNHVMWVWGTESLEAFIERVVDQVTLVGVADEITVPFLVVHGEHDRQIPVEDAHQSYREATHSPDRQLRILAPQSGASEHIGLDNLSIPTTYIADWVSERLHRLSPSARLVGLAPAVRPR